MAVTAITLHPAHERGLARVNMRRSPQAGVPSQSSSSTASVLPTSTPTPQSTATSVSPRTVTALIALVVVFAVVILGLAIWKFIDWRRSRHVAASTLVAQDWEAGRNGRSNKTSYLDLATGTIVTKKPNKAVLLPPAPPSPDANTGWVPQIKPWMHPPGGPLLKGASGVEDKEKLVLSEKSDVVSVELRTPPPTYGGHGQDRPPSFLTNSTVAPGNRTMPPIPPPLQAQLPSLPTPPSSASSSSSAKLSVILPSPNEVPNQPCASPRTDSMSPKNTGAGKSGSKYDSARRSTSGGSSKKLPRLMAVTTSFSPQLEDELGIQVGDTLRLLEEYEDEWCLVQRVGRHDAAKGVVPRLCLSERPEVIPIPRKNGHSFESWGSQHRHQHKPSKTSAFL